MTLIFREAYQLENVILTNRKEKTYNIPKKGVQVMDEEMTAIEMQRFLNQQYAEGKTELEAYRNLMAILGLSYPQKSENKKEGRKPSKLLHHNSYGTNPQNHQVATIYFSKSHHNPYNQTAIRSETL